MRHLQTVFELQRVLRRKAKGAGDLLQGHAGLEHGGEARQTAGAMLGLEVFGELLGRRQADFVAPHADGGAGHVQVGGDLGVGQPGVSIRVELGCDVLQV
jgi:hypothetical protein